MTKPTPQCEHAYPNSALNCCYCGESRVTTTVTPQWREELEKEITEMWEHMDEKGMYADFLYEWNIKLIMSDLIEKALSDQKKELEAKHMIDKQKAVMGAAGEVTQAFQNQRKQDLLTLKERILEKQSNIVSSKADSKYNMVMSEDIETTFYDFISEE